MSARAVITDDMKLEMRGELFTAAADMLSICGLELRDDRSLEFSARFWVSCLIAYTSFSESVSMDLGGALMRRYLHRRITQPEIYASLHVNSWTLQIIG